MLHERVCSEEELCAFAAQLAEHLRAGDCVLLSGDLGAGKSTWVRAAIRAVCDVDDVPSPTFTLAQHYEGKKGPITHFDLYRLKAPEDVYELGLEDSLVGIVFIEWPERAKSLLPPHALQIELSPSGNGQARLMRLSGNSSWQSRLQPLLR